MENSKLLYPYWLCFIFLGLAYFGANMFLLKSDGSFGYL